MTPTYVVDIGTPKKFVLRGLWFGPKKPKRVIVWVHGLGSSAFSMRNVIAQIVDEDTSVLTFNNRGSYIVSKLYSARKNGKDVVSGAAHEKFTDCVDDIQGAVNFARKQGVKEIYLAGHSTGCQKSIYWAYKQKARGVKGIILLAPVSDYATALAHHGRAKLARVEKYARQLVRSGKGDELIPASLWPEEPVDAQRFLSLYTADSVEEIFSYAQPTKDPRALKSVRAPILALLAQSDEYWDRPAEDVAAWFENNLKTKHRIVIVPKVGHSFTGGEKAVASALRKFMKEC